MNILYLTQFFSNSKGGSPLLFYDFAKSLSERGNNIHVICNLVTDDALPKVNIHQVKPYLKDTSQLPTSIVPNLQYMVNAVLKGIKIIEKNDIQIIHTNSFVPVIAGSVLGKIKKVPVVATIHDVFTDKKSNRWQKWLEVNRYPKYYRFLGELVERISLAMPIDSIHTISQASCRDILELKSKAKIRVIPPSVDQNNYKASSQVRYENFVLYIGRLVYYKNVEILLRALQIVLKDFQNFELIIVGEGPMKQSLKELAKNLGIEKNIVFLGSISNIQKIDLLNRCLALAFPSTFEGFGLVILESFLFKKPVLLSDINPFDEIVDDGKDGYLIPPYEHVEWANKIKHLINNIDMCRNMGLNGYNKYLTKYEYSNHIDNIENLYMSLIK